MDIQVRSRWPAQYDLGGTTEITRKTKLIKKEHIRNDCRKRRILASLVNHEVPAVLNDAGDNRLNFDSHPPVSRTLKHSRPWRERCAGSPKVSVAQRLLTDSSANQ